MSQYKIITPTGWGTPGDVIELSDAEGAAGVESGIVIAVGGKERAVVEPRAERSVADAPRSRKRKPKRRAKKA